MKCRDNHFALIFKAFVRESWLECPLAYESDSHDYVIRPIAISFRNPPILQISRSTSIYLIQTLIMQDSLQQR